MGSIIDLDVASGVGGGVTSYNDLTNKPNYKFTQTLTDSITNVVTHNIGSSQDVVNVVVYDGNENIQISNWSKIDENSINIPMAYEIIDAVIYIQCK